MAVQVSDTIPFVIRTLVILGRGCTVTAKFCMSDKLGVPLSITITDIALVVFTRSGAGVQVNCPVRGSMLAPAGALLRLKVSIWAGKSRSIARLVNAKVVPS